MLISIFLITNLITVNSKTAAGLDDSQQYTGYNETTSTTTFTTLSFYSYYDYT